MFKSNSNSKNRATEGILANLFVWGVALASALYVITEFVAYTQNLIGSIF